MKYLRGALMTAPLWLISFLTPSLHAGGKSVRDLIQTEGVHGGLVVHLGCGDGKITAALQLNAHCLVHGLDTAAENVAAARRHLQSLGLYGPISVDRLTGTRLPYTDNLVNLLVSEDLGKIPMAEVTRVLRPGGVAYIKKDGRWSRSVKPRPQDIDEWTHFLHGPDNNAVSHDKVVGPPRHMQWLGKPKFARAHEQLASLGACVTAGGRVFYIIDQAPVVDVRLPSRWALVCRDAFNGVTLWTRRMTSWADQLRRFRSGPADLGFRLAASADRVYATLGIASPVSALDAATGRTLWTCKESAGARQILHVADKLFILVDTRPQVRKEIDSQVRRGIKPAPGERRVVAASAADGSVLWTRKVLSFVQPTLAAAAGRIVYQTTEDLYCLDAKTGDELWHVARKLRLKGHELGWESPTLVIVENVALSADFRQVVAYSLQDGRPLWSRPGSAGYNSPPDLMVIGNLVWTKGKGTERAAVDLATGKPGRRFASPRGYMHPRCYRNKATDRFLLLGNQGVQFLDVASGETWLNYWIRGTCQYGIMPANGLLYVTPDSCACNLETKLNGFWALAPARRSKPQGIDGPRLERGPAFADLENAAPPAAATEDWPFHRRDAARSGCTPMAVAPGLRQVWRAPLGGRLSAVTEAGGKVFVASVDTHAVHALDAGAGKPLWSFTAGGRIDSPPTIAGQRLLFGSADGWVYCLRTSDGKLAWRFRAAPESRLVFANGQLESVWPVHGSVLVRGSEVIVAAGRSSYIDGGIRLYRLALSTGKLLSETAVYSPDPVKGKQPPEGGKDMRGLLSDILLADGNDVYMRHVKLDFETGSETGKGRHLFSPTGLLDGSWWHRSYWVLNDVFLSHWSAWWKIGNLVPSGRIMATGRSLLFGYGRDKYPKGNTGQWRGGEKYQLFACDRDFDRGGPAKPGEPPFEYRWTRRVPILVRALVAAGDTLFVAGPPDVGRAGGDSGEAALVLENPDEILAAWQGRKGGRLLAVSARDGRTLADLPLDSPPVFDGMAAAQGRLYLSTLDGSVVCLGPAARP